jgi:small subunit ribosomal protein S8
MMTDPLGDMLTRIRNGQSARRAAIVAPASGLRLRERRPTRLCPR